MSEPIRIPHPFFSEKTLFFTVIILCLIGITMVYSASWAIGEQHYGTGYYFAKKQALFFLISLGVMTITASFPHQFYRHISYLILTVAIALLVLVLFPGLKVEGGNAFRWLNLFGFTFQPAELAKLALVLFMAYSLSKKQEMIEDFKVGFFPHVMILALLGCLIIVQPDFGTIVVMGLITWGMMFIAGVKITHLISPLPIAGVLTYFLVYKVDYRWDRVIGFLRPWDDPLDKGYHLTHSLKAIGSGGIFGKGIALSVKKMHYLPAPHTDFIFSIIGEELGLIGILGVLGLYLIVVLRGIQITRNATSFFSMLAAAGLTLFIAVHVLINTGVALGLLPTKGLTLPFISYGGTSLVVCMAAIGILINIGASGQYEHAS